MYCIRCGVKLEDGETRCPLCNIDPDTYVQRKKNAKRQYPQNKYPPTSLKPQAANGAILFLFFIPFWISFFIDLQTDGNISWFYYVAGALIIAYLFLAFPFWFKKPNPVVLVPCDFAAIALYLLLISLMTNGSWYFTFALPITVYVALIITAVVVLLKYLKKGRLYVIGGAFMAFGALAIITELLLTYTFKTSFTGWSVYPLISQVLFGGMLIYIAINKTLREKMERRFFF